MSSEIAVDESCVSAFQELKSKRAVNTVIYRLSSTLDAVVLESQGNLTHDELLQSLPADEPRIIVYDLAFATADGARMNEVVMISWLPEASGPEHEAAYVRASAALRDALDGIQVLVQATGLSALEHRKLVSRLN
ncbi:hypothetical protein AB0M39_40800 [Streptomyces sp. NPDC051907]|uniref:hypothetical protein n=1 Tax=Streptomyces sp. NPDC051907 TaxID=3155284 RepID=UPI00341B613D